MKNRTFVPMKTNPFKEYFYFIKSDRRAIVALGCIAVFAIGVLMLYRPSPQPSPVMGRETMRGVGDELEGLPIMGEMSAGQRGSLVAFDPNTVDSLTLIGFGLKDWKVKNFLHYRAAGKVFRSAEEMGKTYGWTEEDVEKVRKYVVVGEKYGKNGKKGKGWDMTYISIVHDEANRKKHITVDKDGEIRHYVVNDNILDALITHTLFPGSQLRESAKAEKEKAKGRKGKGKK